MSKFICNLDFVKIWTKSSDIDIVVLSKTWIKKFITDKDIAIKGYNVFFHLRKADGIAI